MGESDVLQRVAALACHVAGVDGAAVLVFDGGQARSLTVVARHGHSGALTAALVSQGGPVAQALASGRAAAEAGEARGVSAAAPLMVGDEARGVLAVSGAEHGRRLEAEQLDMLTDLAGLGASSLLEHDLRARAEAVLEAGAGVLAHAVDMRDAYTGRHSAQVGALARRVGRRIGMPSADVALLECAARLHDVGKLAVPDVILQKPGPLDKHEWEVMRCHPEWGAEMVAGVPGLERLAELVAAHHERWDGDGYPHGLTGADIPLASRVISACDAFEAMISTRPYRPRLTTEHALAELLAGAGSQFDPAVVAAVELEAVLG